MSRHKLNWRHLVSEAHKRWQNEGVVLPVPLGASNGQIINAESEVGLSFPPELRSFYLSCDGEGFNPETGVCLGIVPLELLPKLKSEADEWLSATHPEIARAYLPFLSWGDGDSIGYLMLEPTHPRIVEFSHEDFNFSADQNWAEFLKPCAFETLEEFLRV